MAAGSTPPSLVAGFVPAVAGARQRGLGRRRVLGISAAVAEAWGSTLQILVDVTVLTAVAVVGPPFSGNRATSHQERNRKAQDMTESRRTSEGPAPSPAARMTAAEFRSMFESLRSTCPWGPDDRRGALNHLTPAEALAATREVRLGRSVSLAAKIETEVTPDDPEPARNQLSPPLATEADRGVTFSLDRIDMNIHGNADSHIDALSHVLFDGQLYNGVRADANADVGPVELSIATAADGIVGRGVLLDIPRSRGVAWLEPGDNVTVDDLLAAERDQKVQVGRGDILLVRVGHRERRRELGSWNAAKRRAGLHPEVMPLLAERQIAALGSDGNGDTAPSLTDGVDFPVHVLAVSALGMMLMDYLDFGNVKTMCEEAARWSFLCVIAPLRLPTGTGSPINAIAVL